MGNEIAQFIEWDYKREIDWFLLEYPIHKQFNDFMKDLNKSLGLLEDVVDYVEMTELESVMFKTKYERLVMENYYFCQDMNDLYELVEQQYFILKTYAVMKGEDNNDTD